MIARSPSTRVLLLMLLVPLSACAPRLTPQQEWVITNFDECKAETGAFVQKGTTPVRK